MNYTYLTVLSTDSYLMGALVLYESLKRTQPKYPFTVLITKNVSSSAEETLKKKGIRVIRIDDCILMDAEHQKQNENVGYKYWNYTFDSLYVFELIEFEKIVYLDCDVLILENLDHLFDKPHLSACIDPGSTDLSSGIMVIEPKQGALKELMDVIPEVKSQKYYFGDQNIIQACYKTWPNQEELHLDDKYNAFVGYLQYFVNSKKYTFRGTGNNIAIVHFLGAKKPWMRSEEETKQICREYSEQGNPYGIEMLKYYQELIEVADQS